MTPRPWGVPSPESDSITSLPHDHHITLQPGQVSVWLSPLPRNQFDVLAGLKISSSWYWYVKNHLSVSPPGVFITENTGLSDCDSYNMAAIARARVGFDCRLHWLQSVRQSDCLEENRFYWSCQTPHWLLYYIWPLLLLYPMYFTWKSYDTFVLYYWLKYIYIHWYIMCIKCKI